MNIGMLLHCPTCGENCHTLHQHYPKTEKAKPELKTVNQEESEEDVRSSSKNLPQMDFYCLYCKNPCHVVVSLSDVQQQQEQSSTLTEMNPDQEVEALTEMDPDQEVEAKESETSDETSPPARPLNGFFFQFSGINNTKLACLQCDHKCHSMDNNKPALFEKIVKTKQISNSGFFVQNLSCSCCKTSCHKIYTQPSATRSSEAGVLNEDNPDLADIFL